MSELPSAPLFELPLEPSVIDKLREAGADARIILGRVAAAGLLIVGASVAVFVTEGATEPAPAVAYDSATGDYPWADAPHISQPPASDTLTWGYPNKATCDNKSADYDCNTNTVGGNFYRDQWGYDLRNCTSYVAWRLAAEFGVNSAGLGNARNWDDVAPSKGWLVTSTPEVGDVAVFENTPNNIFGHVEFVVGVNANGSVNTDQYNNDLQGNFGHANGIRADHYIDVNGSNPPGFTLRVGNTPPPPPPDTDADGVPDASDWAPLIAGPASNNGRPNDITQISSDLNGDGKKDIIAISRNPDNSPGISWFQSTASGSAASVADPSPLGVSLPAPAWNLNGIQANTGDFNGDGKGDLLLVSGSDGTSPNVYILLSNGTGYNSPALVKSLNPAAYVWSRLAFKVGDFNGDGKSDVIYTSRNYDNSPNIGVLLSTSSGSTASVADPTSLKSLPAPAWSVDTLKTVVGDFNGDGKSDIVMMSGAQGVAPTIYEMTSNGTALSDPVAVKSPNPAAYLWPNLQLLAGDINGDGKSDVVYISRNADGTPNIGEFLSTSTLSVPSLADPVGLKSLGSAWQAGYLKWAIEDINGDGKADLVALSGSDTAAPTFYAFLATATGLADPTLVNAPNPAYWWWIRVQV